MGGRTANNTQLQQIVRSIYDITDGEVLLRTKGLLVPAVCDNENHSLQICDIYWTWV